METTTKHFEFTGETKKIGIKITLHRIRTTIETEHAKIGDLGGWIEKPENLCDNAWVSGEACVYGNAKVYGDTWVRGKAQVYDKAKVSDNAWVSGEACVYGEARVFGEANIYNDAKVYGNAKVYGDTWVRGKTQVYDKAKVYNAWVSDNAIVCGDARVYDYAQVSGNADIKSNNDHCGFDCFGFVDRHTHAYRTIEGVEITGYDLRGSIDEYAAKLKETYSGSRYEKQFDLIISIIKLKFNLPD